MSRSLSSQKKCGISIFEVHGPFPLGGSDNQTGTTAEALLREFDRLCRSLPGNGLVCCAAAATVLSTQQTQMTSSLISHDISLQFSDESARTGDNDGHASVSVNINRYVHNADISISLHWSLNLDPATSKIDEGAGPQTNVHVQLEGDYVPIYSDRNKVYSDAPASTSEELKVLLQMSRTAVEKLCAQINFESRNNFIQQVAEVLLSTVQFASPHLSLQGVKVSMYPAGDSTTVVDSLHAEKWQKTQRKAAERQLESSVAPDVKNAERPRRCDPVSINDKPEEVRMSSGKSISQSSITDDPTEDHGLENRAERGLADLAEQMSLAPKNGRFTVDCRLS